jgi:hypothetical protein
MTKNYVRPPEDLKLEPSGMGKAEMTFAVYDFGRCKPKDGRILLKHSRSMREIQRDDGYDLSVDINLNTVFYGFEAKDLERISTWAHKAALWVKDREKRGL